MQSMVRPAAAAFVTLVAFCGCSAWGAGAGEKLVEASLLADAQVVVPGGSFTLGVRLVMKPHWHTYWVNPGEAGDATKVKLSGPPGFTFGPIQWPLPTRIDAPGGVSFGYEGEVMLLVPVTVSKDVPAGKADLNADVSWLVCKEECIKGGAKLAISLAVGAKTEPANRERFDAWAGRLPASREQAASEAVSDVEQPAGADEAPAAALKVRWRQPPRKVEWFPVATRAVAVDDVTVRHDGLDTLIEFKPKVYKPAEVPGGKVESVLIYEDAAGRRRGVSIPFAVGKAE